MERKITIMVFVLASVLVFAGFAANEKAYGGAVFNGPNGNGIISPIVDDLHCYNVSPGGTPVAAREVRLTDQFEELAEHIIVNLKEICNPVQKITDSHGSSPITTFQHWAVYEMTLPQTSPQLIARVEITDQFHPNGFEVDVLDHAPFLMVPTFKEHDGGHPNLSEIHFKCWELGDADPVFDNSISLLDQFTVGEYTSIQPVKICNPVEKFKEVTPGDGNFVFAGGDNDIPEHYLCYETVGFEIDNSSLLFSIVDQFLSGPQGRFTETVLCTIAQKIIVPPPIVGGFNVPIDTSSLLLAGVQSISMWMIPVVIAGIGIGIFVIKRRK